MWYARIQLTYIVFSFGAALYACACACVCVCVRVRVRVRVFVCLCRYDCTVTIHEVTSLPGDKDLPLRTVFR